MVEDSRQLQTAKAASPLANKGGKAPGRGNAAKLDLTPEPADADGEPQICDRSFMDAVETDGFLGHGGRARGGLRAGSCDPKPGNPKGSGRVS